MASQPPPPAGPNQPKAPYATSSTLVDDPGVGNVWDEPQNVEGHTDATKSQDAVPASLRPGGGFVNLAPQESNVWDEARTSADTRQDKSQSSNQTHALEQVPAALKPGGDRTETNPFLRNKTAASDPPPDLTQYSNPTPPADTFARLDLNETSNNPWQSAIDSQNQQIQHNQQPSHSPPPPPAPPLQHYALDADRDPWSNNPVELPAHVDPDKSADLISLGSEDSGSSWDDSSDSEQDEKPKENPKSPVPDEIANEQHVWDDLGTADGGKGKITDAPVAQPAQIDDWNLVDAEPAATPPAQPPGGTSSNEPAAADAATREGSGDEERPSLPPRRSGPQAHWVHSRDPVDGKAETYQVKNIRWHDPNASKNPRTSPILIQNLNGPCPLVALVNALTLTTEPDYTDTALIETLRSREQVSLNLVLDAVFDELMSPRRTSSDVSLPDVGDLYGFLQSLHTGMNVNPRFIPTPELINAYKRTSLTHLHPAERGNLIPGTFENTMEMSLYATFSIPLIHGWLPPRDEAAYEALQRRAASYEEAQNLLFLEEELENKLSSAGSGLTEEEQRLYQDIVTIKMFLNASATQLTPCGIEVISKAIRPGTFAILFRNDHFSTLYCHPQTMQLLTLVTDEGYKSHDEVVWETLTDVNGEHTEYLSGDFRVVSSASGAGPSNIGSNSGYANQGSGDWTTVANKRGKSKEEDPEPPMSPKHEQEDRDLALALQLQEEEEQKQREDEARRRHERQLSEQFIEQQGRQPPAAFAHGRGGSAQGHGRGQGFGGFDVPVTTQNNRGGRGSNQSGPTRASIPAAQPQQEIRPLLPTRRPGVTRAPDEGGEPPPPSYEQSANDPTFVPPSEGSSASASRPGGNGGVGPAGLGRRPAGYPGSGSGGTQQGRNRDRECVVM